jgi:hypothetical protein
MISKLIKWGFYFIVILIIFALLPKSSLEKLKTFFNWDVFLNTLKKGFNNLVNFLKEIIKVDFNQILSRLKIIFGIDLIALWSAIKNFLANFFLKLANIFK